MRTIALSLCMTLAAVLVQGCISIHSEEVHSPEPGTYEARDTTIREIKVAGMLSFDNDRQKALKRIARRSGISDAAQVRLVETTFRRLSFEESKVDVLMTLVKNSSFSPAAEAAILGRLSQLSFERDRSKILGAISSRKG